MALFVFEKKKHDKTESGTVSIYYGTGTSLLPGRVGSDGTGAQWRCYLVAVGGRLSWVMTGDVE